MSGSGTGTGVGVNSECDHARKAFLADQSSCIRTRGEDCFAYGGGGCKSCSKRKEGIKRRLAAFRKEKEQTITEKVSWAGETVRERKDGDYLCIEFGRRPSDAKTIFIVKRSIIITSRERNLLKGVLCGK
ncbi:MAG: hypothetical protein WC238_05130 [Parcubacteria group bacterium]